MRHTKLIQTSRNPSHYPLYNVFLYDFFTFWYICFTRWQKRTIRAGISYSRRSRYRERKLSGKSGIGGEKRQRSRSFGHEKPHRRWASEVRRRPRHPDKKSGRMILSSSRPTYRGFGDCPSLQKPGIRGSAIRARHLAPIFASSHPPARPAAVMLPPGKNYLR